MARAGLAHAFVHFKTPAGALQCVRVLDGDNESHRLFEGGYCVQAQRAGVRSVSSSSANELTVAVRWAVAPSKGEGKVIFSTAAQANAALAGYMKNRATSALTVRVDARSLPREAQSRSRKLEAQAKEEGALATAAFKSGNKASAKAHRCHTHTLVLTLIRCRLLTISLTLSCLLLV